MTNSRKLAIKNLQCSDEKLRLNWMLDNMEQNKTFVYLSRKNDNDYNKNLIHSLRKRYINYREQWRGNAKHAIDKNLIGKKFNESNLNHFVQILKLPLYVI